MLKEKTSDVSMTNTNQGSGTAAEAAVPMSRGLWNTWRKNLLLFCLTGVYVELCLHLCVFGSMDRYAGYPVLFGLLGGALCTLVVSSLPKVLRQITGVFLVAAQVLLAEVQLVYHCIFGDFMPVSQIGMGGNVVVNFNSQLLYGIRQNLLKILLLLLPLIAVILCLALRRGQALKLRLRWKQTMASSAVLLALLLTVTGLMYVGRDNAFSVYRTFTNVNTSTDSSYKKIGMLATTAQELRYMLFSGSGSIMITPSSLNMSDVPRTYSSNSYNVIESIDFTALADSTDSDILKATDEYLSNATPTRKNNYTGLLKDYNLITICAESFCPWFISEELTPTLYKLSHTGILFENYYGTFQSVTTNGEYTMCMGLYPDMSRTKTDSSFNVAGTNYLPFCLGNALKGMGYQAWGYHDYIGDFYNRNITHANMGYTFKAADSGLAMKIDWPSSDLEMMEASIDDYINSGEPFHAYYMTFSGHYQYNWDNAMSAKNRDAVKDLPYSEPVKAYIACNLELEYALEYLMQRLEQAGVADKTCIVLTNDHYPYGLTEDEYNELAGQTLDTTFEKYRNSFICYVPGLSENIVVDEYCSTADILPTLLNLFGVDYDSRLLAGTDVLSSGLHVAVLSDKSFLTKTFRYDAGTETVIPADENTTVSDELAEAYRLYVDSRFQLSGNILNSDYYAHVFSKESSGGSLADTVVFTDIKSIFNQASVLYMYRKGYVDPETPDTFGGKATARLGEFVDVLYRIAGRPETDNTALPADYENEEFNAAHPYYNAVCWAYQTRLLRQNDPNAEYDDKVDYQTACVLIRRYAIMAGVDTGVDQTQLRQLLRDAPDLGREAVKAMLWCDEKDITTRDSNLDELLASAGTPISRYQMTSFLIYLCTYELDIGS
ncbi:LTA synthase family protein [Oscillibacter sp. ER4]|uniref:LTA synthase family protein n=1 Tax=Oscillibacter sp. ER4 TaxID=1519439 RepID=UPI00051B1620|nr:LTA synthase family protein [Oscillibacter sp. ER4]